MKVKSFITIAIVALFIAGCATQRGPICRKPHPVQHNHPVHVYSK
jgi:hypothetical protein